MSDNRNILIVDDNESLARTMSLVLRRRGFDTSTAKNGREAVERALGEEFDVILMDIKMPELNGVDAYRQIKESRPDALVLMMTAYAVDDLIQQALAEGAYGVVYKPVDVDKIIGLIEKARRTTDSASVLLVDDQPGMCITLRNILTRRGCQVQVANTGEAAIALAEKEAFDVIFIDMKLPTIDGLQTYQGIKKVRPGALVIVMTGYREEMAERVTEALNSCAYTCLYKPLDMANVLMLIDDVQQRHAHDQRPAPQG